MPEAMSSRPSKTPPKNSLQETPNAGKVQKLSQQFLQAASWSTISRPSSSLIRYQPLVIPQTFAEEYRQYPSIPFKGLDRRTPSPSPSPSPSSSPPSSSRPPALASVPQPATRDSSGASAARQQSAPQLSVQLTSPTMTSAPTLPKILSSGYLPSSVSVSSTMTLDQSAYLAGALSMSSIGSNDSFVSALSHIDSPGDPGSPRCAPMWKQILDAIEQEDREELDRILHAFDFAIVIQTLVMWTYPNGDNHYRHDPDVLLDAKELLGPKVDHLNLIQIACFLINEEIALDLLNFVAKASEELESKKVLYEFMGKVWGEGNTTLHLASFLGMADLTKRLLDLGANTNKMNQRKYKPVDCADENTTLELFLNLTEVVRYRKIGEESAPTSPISGSDSEHEWSTLKMSIGHMRSPSTSTLPLMMLATDSHRIGLDDPPGNPSAPFQWPARPRNLGGSTLSVLHESPIGTTSQVPTVQRQNGFENKEDETLNGIRADNLEKAQESPANEKPAVVSSSLDMKAMTVAGSE
ncbi:hypothetical protein BGW38_008269, partial [Lunasporangiospora selenospora]